MIDEYESDPPCEKHAGIILDALQDYLDQVKNMTSYGTAMTSAETALVPVRSLRRRIRFLCQFLIKYIVAHAAHYYDSYQMLGDIAIGLATQGAINQANANITLMLAGDPPKSLVTAPNTVGFQNAYNDLFYPTDVDSSKKAIAYIPAMSQITKQYVASKVRCPR